VKSARPHAFTAERILQYSHSIALRRVKAVLYSRRRVPDSAIKKPPVETGGFFEEARSIT